MQVILFSIYSSVWCGSWVYLIKAGFRKTAKQFHALVFNEKNILCLNTVSEHLSMQEGCNTQTLQSQIEPQFYFNLKPELKRQGPIWVDRLEVFLSISIYDDKKVHGQKFICLLLRIPLWSSCSLCSPLLCNLLALPTPLYLVPADEE